ncbi:MAG: anaerobic glycerol-3-phosphate dehydrogenase subunit C [Sporolactobacillus sp.]
MPELSLLDDSYEKCLKCNACVAECPVSEHTLAFGGPKHLGPELRRFVSSRAGIDDARVDYCTLCGNCELSCPENVHVASLMAYAKMIHTEKKGTPFRDFVLSNAELVGKLASTFAPITNATMKIKPVRLIMQQAMHIAADRQFPAYRFKTLNRTFSRSGAARGASHPAESNQSMRKVAYFAGCYATYNAPEVGESFLKVMRFNGIEVIKPTQKCCGVPMMANGRMKQARKNAEFNTRQLLAYVRRGYDVVATCTSCSLALKKEYLSLVGGADAKQLAEHVYDAGEYVRMLKETGELNEQLASVEETAGYHTPCHLRAQSIGSPALDILELIPGYQIQDLGSGCCGQCGTFGFKKEKYSISMQLGKEMADAVSELDASVTVTECGMCKNQLDQLTDKPVRHPMQILAASYEKAAAGKRRLTASVARS